jgi:hypothetical protein
MPNGAGLLNPPFEGGGRSIDVVANGSKVSKSIDAVRDEVLVGNATGHVGDRGERGGRGGGDLKLSTDFA